MLARAAHFMYALLIETGTPPRYIDHRSNSSSDVTERDQELLNVANPCTSKPGFTAFAAADCFDCCRRNGSLLPLHEFL
jgi:hypothetical protein